MEKYRIRVLTTSESVLQVYVREICIDMLNKNATGFSMEYYEKYFSVLLIIVFDYLFHHNPERLHSSIKLCVVVKYTFRL